MTDPKDDDKTASDELRDGLLHLFSAARKVIKTAEPTVNRSLDDAERVISKIGRGGEVVAGEVGKEVALLASRLADKLRAVANRAEGNVPDERTPPAPPPPDANANANAGDGGAHEDKGPGGDDRR